MCEDPNDSLAYNSAWLEQMIAVFQALNENESPVRCRELSLAITKLEEARHWLNAIELP